VSLKFPTSVKRAAAELAATAGVSLNQFIAAAVAEKVGSLRAANDFLRERAGVVSKNSNDAADAAGVGRSDESSDIIENMPFSFAPLKFLVLMFAGNYARVMRATLVVPYVVFRRFGVGRVASNFGVNPRMD
jgi:hypothetical protein